MSYVRPAVIAVALAPYSKAIAALVAAFVAALIALAPDGITAGEVGTAALTAIGAAAGVYAAPSNRRRDGRPSVRQRRHHR